MMESMGSSALVVVLGVAGCVLGCGKSAPAPGKVVELEQVCNEADGSRVRLTGYLRYRRGLLSFCSTFGGHETCDLELDKTSAAPPAFDVMHPQTGPDPISAKLSVPVGDKTGEMSDLPEKFSASDIHLHLPNGAIAGDGTRITVDGSLSVVPSDPKTPSAPKSCFLNVEWATPG